MKESNEEGKKYKQETKIYKRIRDKGEQKVTKRDRRKIYEEIKKYKKENEKTK